MAKNFYRTYPKKLNKDKSNLGFVDIYDLDKRFMILKILGIDNLIIENIFKKDENDNFDYTQIDKSLGQTRDFYEKISLAHDLGVSIILRIDLNKRNKSFDRENFLSNLNFWIAKGVDGFLFDDCKNLTINLESVFSYLRKTYKNLNLILNAKEKKDFSSINSRVNLSFKDLKKEGNLKTFILNENKNKIGFSLNGDLGFEFLNFLDFKHFYKKSAKLMVIISLIRPDDVFIKEGEETLYYLDKVDRKIRKEIFDFYREIFLVRYDYLDIIKGGYFPIKFKNKNVLSYMYYKENKAIVILNNLSQKDIMIDLPKFLDIGKSSYISGNIFERKIVRNINLRSYESLVFETYIRKF